MHRWITALIVVCLASPSPAEDWPRWRGPRGDGTWHGPKLPEKWPEGGLKPKWKVPIGGGYSGRLFGNLLREFSPDLLKKLKRKKS